MRRLIAFSILCGVKIFSHLFFKAKFNWITPKPQNPWKDLRVMIFLNHTSLYEPLFSQIIPFHYLWYLSAHFNIPGADITLSRPIVGRFWKLMIPQISSISRRKDSTWDSYLNSISSNDVVMIAPEGRMKRLNGLDKHGHKMNVKGGVADIIDEINQGKLIICLSGGLHHVQAPGQFFPRLFQTISMNLCYFDIPEYKSQFSGSPRERKIKLIQDLQNKLENHCP
jgi:hypothetical protein